VRDQLRQGDPAGLARADSADVIVEAIRDHRAIVVPVINLLAEKKPDDLGCQAARVGVGKAPHWVLGDQAPTVTVGVPSDFGVVEAFEVQDRQTLDAPVSVDAPAREIRLPAVALSNETPVRLFVLAKDAALRGEVEQALVAE
jgi:hypothetical protein